MLKHVILNETIKHCATHAVKIKEIKMQLTKFKIHESLIQPKTYYSNIQGTNWNVQIMLAKIGVSQKNTHHSKQVFTVYVNNGYGGHEKLIHHIQGLSNAKKVGLKLLTKTFNEVHA